ncbi:hypothetical protein GF345_00635 [Candidatus Woesearchaeota archaeon]|nr:hypothetical protein [Candidatus Woesearchaeota archaeon]
MICVLVFLLLFAPVVAAVCGGSGDEYNYVEDIDYTCNNATILPRDVDANVVYEIECFNDDETQTYTFTYYFLPSFNGILYFMKKEIFEDKPQFNIVANEILYFEGEPLLLLDDDCGHIYWTTDGADHKFIMFEGDGKFPKSLLQTRMENNPSNLKEVISEGEKKYPPITEETGGLLIDNIDGFTLKTDFSKGWLPDTVDTEKIACNYVSDDTGERIAATIYEFDDSDELDNVFKDFISYTDFGVVDNNIIYISKDRSFLFWMSGDKLVFFGPEMSSSDFLDDYDNELVQSYLNRYPSQFNKFIRMKSVGYTEHYGGFLFTYPESISRTLDDSCLKEVGQLLEDEGFTGDRLEWYSMKECTAREIFYEKYGDLFEVHQKYSGSEFADFFEELWEYRNKEFIEEAREDMGEQDRVCEYTYEDGRRIERCYDRNPNPELVLTEEPVMSEEIVDEGIDTGDEQVVEGIEDTVNNKETDSKNVMTRIISWIKSIFGRH